MTIDAYSSNFETRYISLHSVIDWQIVPKTDKKNCRVNTQNISDSIPSLIAAGQIRCFQ